MKQYLKYGILSLSLVFAQQTAAQSDFDNVGGSESSSELSSNASDRIERLERSLSVLEREVYRGTTKKRKSSEPFAEEISPTGSNVEVRLSEIENKLRELVGKVEELEFKNKKLEDTVERLLNSGVSPAPVSSNQPTSEPADSSTSNAGSDSANDGTKELGTTTPTSAAIEDVKGQYDAAFNLLRQAKYEEAAQGFHQFIEENPKHELIGNAYYWLGESFFVQKDYEQSSVSFLQGYQAEPKGTKAPDNLLKLAISLGGLKKKREACATFAKLSKEFPSASKSIKNKATEESKRIGC